MKARVKATGEIVEVIAIDGDWLFCSDGAHYGIESIEAVESEIDYWTRLEHQYARMAMQAYIIASHISHFCFCENDIGNCKHMAHALVEKMKEERK